MMEIHYISMIVIGIGSFVFGLLPMGLSFRATRSYAFILSLMLCLGAGILLATSLIHMLTEVQTKLKESAQLYFCAGFLILYAFDEISHYCLGFKRPEIHSSSTLNERCHIRRYNENGNYGALSETQPLFYVSGDQNKKFEKEVDSQQHHSCDHSLMQLRYGEGYFEVDSRQSLSGISSHSCDFHQDQIHSHVEIDEPSSSSLVAKSGLLIALLIHSLLEGVSIGIQTEISQILLILGAVGFHKAILSFCLGLELHSNGYKHLNLVIAIFLFSIGSPIGIFIGMSVTGVDSIFSVDAQLQAIAAGSLLYVAALEVLPRERFKWQHNNNQKAAGIIQLIFLILGFLCITAFHLFLGPGHDMYNKFGNVTVQPSY